MKKIHIVILALLSIYLSTTTGLVAAREYTRWSWLKDTYWVVPEDGIYSITHLENENSFVVTQGQTVFHITDYFNGYFTGITVVKLGMPLIPSCQFHLGQVTPEGRVHLTMYDATTGTILNYPIGMMVREHRQWTMVNQMTAPYLGGTLSHWAYMIESKEGDKYWNDLPFAHESIPEFLSSCPPGPMIKNPLNFEP